MKRLLSGLCALGVLALPAVGSAPATAAQIGVPGAAGVQQTWSADQIRAPEARRAGNGGQGVTVAVLDTWVDGSHPDFENRVLAGADCVGGRCRPGQRTDQCNHGTHVAGTVASSSFGIAPRARVLPVRVLSYNVVTGECTGRPKDVAAGIRYALAQGVRVLNLSLGADLPGLAGGPLPRAVEAAVDKGAVVVLSAGNSNAPIADVYDDRALVVAATGPDAKLASYSQRGAGVSLAAPGGDAAGPDACTRTDCITSLYPGGRYAVAAGTSMAAPAVSATAAMLFAQDPSRTGASVRARLLRTARPLAGAGAGLLDAAAALGLPAQRAPVAAPTTPVARPLAADPVLPAPSEVPLDIDRSPLAVGPPARIVDEDALLLVPSALAGVLLLLVAGAWVLCRTLDPHRPTTQAAVVRSGSRSRR